MTACSSRRWIGAALLVLGIFSSAWAAPPTVTSVAPRGGQRGQSTEVVVQGGNLSPQTRLLLPFKAAVSLVPDAKPNPAQVRFQVAVDPSVPAGVYPARLASEDGVTPLLLFAVDHFPNVSEVEPNQTPEQAQKVPFPAIVTGQCAGGDVDFFRFPAKKGQRVVVETETARLGTAILPQIRVTDAMGRFLASDDSQRLRGDCRVVFTAAQDGDYVVEFSDSRYRGGAPPHYRLRIGDYDFAEEVFPLGGKKGDEVEFTLRGGSLLGEVKVRRRVQDSGDGSMPLHVDGLKPGGPLPEVAVGDLPERLMQKAGDGKPMVVTSPLVLNGRFAQKGEVERFQLAVQPGQKYRVAVQAEAHGSNLDGVLKISDQTGKQLVLVDDVDVPATVPGQQPTKTADPAVEITVPEKVSHLLIELRDQRDRGGINFGYRLTIELAVADFEVRQPVSEINVPRGGVAVLTVPVARRGYPGPLQLAIPTLPPGFSVQGGHVLPGGNSGVLTISAAADAALADPAPLQIEGVATIEGREVRRTATLKLVLSREANPSSLVRTLTGFVVALTSAEPYTVQGPPVLEAVGGYPVEVPVMVSRGVKPPVAAVEVNGSVPALAPPPGQPLPLNVLAFKAATAAPDAATAGFTLTPGPAAPEGTLDLLVQGKAKVNNVDKTVFGPAVKLTIHRPFTVTLEPAKLELKPGGSVLLKGKLQRQPVFKEAVMLKLDGLPKGVTLAAPPAPAPPAADEFQIELKVDPKATAATANITLTCTATIAGLAHNHPPVVVAVEIK